MRYVVLGGSGFIGSRIKEHLAGLPGAECLAPNSREVDLSVSGPGVNALAELCRGAVVVYAAGIPRSVRDDFETMIRNVTLVENLIKALRNGPPKLLVFLSSVEVYGVPRERSITEETEPAPETMYAVGKITAEHLVRRWRRQIGGALAVMRLPGIYGPDPRGLGLIPALVRAIREQKTFKLYGAGEELRDYVFVDDVGRAAAALAETKIQEAVVNLATGQSVSVAEIIKKAFRIFGPCPIQKVPKNGPADHLVFDPARLKAVLPDLELTSLDQGLEELGRRISSLAA